jgi:hypothetical protein
MEVSTIVVSVNVEVATSRPITQGGDTKRPATCNELQTVTALLTSISASDSLASGSCGKSRSENQSQSVLCVDRFRHFDKLFWSAAPAECGGDIAQAPAPVVAQPLWTQSWHIDVVSE